ncbi:3-hydroxyacyl-CoA dehydrogenase family protein [Paenibacillus agaridevorans]|uniref:3-hydroxyacyl-CoA dehydrogenase family protein n=1 Tax=Paenibacillus agaridevorans TaxID=171404 RepID=UPI001BE46D14|nr:3-hydroxyacyl-CoA dehydrogenase NAD-binding domain-containing protein [Paenibacillus agaridevorans]
MIERIGVLGAGTMGLAIASLFAEHGYEVSLYEPNDEMLRSVKNRLNKGTLNIQLTNNFEKAVAKADLIIECVPEQLTVKREVYRQLASAIRPEAIVASNTSTFPLQTLAQELPFANQMVIVHFFNPAHLIPLVEMVGLPDTPPSILEELAALLRKCGKTPVVLNKDIPGFIANRLQAALMREACYLLDNGVANAAQIDTVVSEGLGLRWAIKGPFEIADLGGLDIWAKVTGQLFPALSISTDTPGTIEKMVACGDLGVKSGSGYYQYDDPAAAAADMNKNLQRLIALKQTWNDELNDN